MDANILENYKEIASQNVGAALIVTGTVVLTPEAKHVGPLLSYDSRAVPRVHPIIRALEGFCKGFSLKRAGLGRFAPKGQCDRERLFPRSKAFWITWGVWMVLAVGLNMMDWHLTTVFWLER